MGWKLHQLDPRLRKRVERALDGAAALKRDVAVVIPGPTKRIRQSKKPLLNKLEQEFKAYWESHTDQKLISQAVRFRLGNGIWYKPDFVRICPEMHVTAFEVKGTHIFRGGIENLKVAASLYPQIEWLLASKDGEEWMMEHVLP